MLNPDQTDLSTNHPYKRFCRFFIYTFLGLYLFTMVFGFFFQPLYESAEYPMWKHSKDTVSTTGTETQKILIIGDSRIKAAFRPSLYEENMMNISVGGGTPIDGYYALKNYLAHNPKPDNIVVSYAPAHFVEPGSFWHRSIRYRYLTAPEYEEIKANAKMLNDSTLGEFRRWKYYLVPNMYWDSIVKGIRKQRWRNYNRVYASLKSEKGHAFFGKRNGSSGKNVETEMSEFKESKLIEHYFIKMIELAVENDIDIFWYTVSFNKSSFEAMNTNFIESFDKYIYSFKKYDIDIINGISYMEDQYFGDSSHLYSGANTVTRNIVETVMGLEVADI